MLFNELQDYLTNQSETSNFKLSIEKDGGYITFSNSSKDKKYFQVSLLSLKKMFDDILINHSIFKTKVNYIEQEWRDLSRYYTDDVIKSISTVQTKPLFITSLKIINWANDKETKDETLIDLDKVSINKTINKLEELIIYFTPNTIQAEKENLLFSDKSKGKENWQKDFQYKNILFKGVPGTGKSRAIDTIIEKYLDIKDEKRNILRVNIHSASSNSDLMQGIGISSDDGNIKYSEKQGLILDIIKRATFHPNQPFVLILEEIQENSLNELIGDLIYLIEEDKRSKLTADNEEYDSYESLVNKLVEDKVVENYVEIPYLVDDSTDYKKMIMPDNLFIFCTSNYRDDKKVIEDNLLRRFEVIEIYPNSDFAEFQEYGKEFFQELNKSILNVMGEEIHPDRFMIGHATWKDVNDKDTFYKAFSKLITEFKDIREIEFDTFKEIVKDINLPEGVDIDIKAIKNYFELIQDTQSKINYEFIN
jgi:5-methylcytosine-specific restriction protein B